MAVAAVRSYVEGVITGFHTIVHSEDPDATRAFFRDVLGWPSVDAGGGWLIYRTPPSELAVHPIDQADGAGDAGGGRAADGPSVPLHQATLMCDDVRATVEVLRGHGVNVADGIDERRYGLVTSIEVPGAGWMLLYQPTHPLAVDL